MEHNRAELASLYLRYNRCCNEHRFTTLAEFVHENVEVNGEARGLAGYIAGLTSVTDAFPDHRWDLRHLLVDGCWLSARFVDTGTHTGPFLGVAGTGRSVTINEFATYRISDGRIAEVWGTADNVALLEQLTAAA
ncbi:ester cyclase [Actinophytocola oryzae]|uniref:Putative ester cyclase n=1 Tax=Actinophytocola oryzae TaxID=502181 RepID=A0A4R7W4N1_9PSEU|nr:ester cyclase [Actinophytocola oryzae]TDV57165.1 putative ester cyclase [Actinophytocola oryzae]